MSGILFFLFTQLCNYNLKVQYHIFGDIVSHTRQFGNSSKSFALLFHNFMFNWFMAIFCSTSTDLILFLLQLAIYSRCYNEQPLVIEGAGAGNDTTAAGVLADILDIQDLFA